MIVESIYIVTTSNIAMVMADIYVKNAIIHATNAVNHLMVIMHALYNQDI